MFTGQFRARGNGNFLVERSSSSILETLRDNSRTIVGGDFNANLAEMRVRFPGYRIVSDTANVSRSTWTRMARSGVSIKTSRLDYVLAVVGWTFNYFMLELYMYKTFF